MDVLRFAAVLLVLHLHGSYVLGSIPWHCISTTLRDWITFVAPPGQRGVDIFFVLSGYLVAGLLINEYACTGSVNLARFFIRRGLKIYPAFWVLILVTAAQTYLQSGHIPVSRVVTDLLFVQNYLPGMWDHTWSLAVEEHFYLILIGIFFVLKARGNGSLRLTVFPRIFDAMVMLCLLAKAMTWWFFTFSSHEHQRWYLWVTHNRIDALFFGALLAYYWHQRWTPAIKGKLLAWRWGWLVSGGLLISPIPYKLLGFQLWHILGFNLAYLGAGCLLLAALSLDKSSVARWLRVPAWMGSHSYSVYLWHMLVLSWVTPVLLPKDQPPSYAIWTELIYIATAWIFGIFAARIIEFPVLRLRDRYFPAMSRRTKTT